jgi:endonuclease YncB( thermonuclease family)
MMGFLNWVDGHKLLVTLVGVVVAFGLLNTVARGADSADGPDGSRSSGSAQEQRNKAGDRPPRKNHERREVEAEPPSPTYLVSSVIDGDTLDLANGERVRLVGIDTPEIGECGYEKARARLVALVGGARVSLGESDEDRDQYGRLLRYVDAGPVDAGLKLLQGGLAIARYDSRDGYGFHPREPEYVRADRGAPDLTCAQQPRRFTPQQQQANCSPGYSPCVPTYPPDVDCAGVNGPVSVTGPDPHGLDADGDGVACEWG